MLYSTERWLSIKKHWEKEERDSIVDDICCVCVWNLFSFFLDYLFKSLRFFYSIRKRDESKRFIDFFFSSNHFVFICLGKKEKKSLLAFFRLNCSLKSGWVIKMIRPQHRLWVFWKTTRAKSINARQCGKKEPKLSGINTKVGETAIDRSIDKIGAMLCFI